MSEQQQDEKIGALWSKSGGKGDYMTGNIEIKPEQMRELVNNGGKLQIVVFKNDRKTGNQPDWRILKAQPKGDRAPVPTVPVANVTDQDVPF